MALWSYFNVTSNYIWPRLWTIIIKYMNCVMFCTFFNNLYGRIQLHGAVSGNCIVHDTCYLPGMAEVASLLLSPAQWTSLSLWMLNSQWGEIVFIFWVHINYFDKKLNNKSMKRIAFTHIWQSKCFLSLTKVALPGKSPHPKSWFCSAEEVWPTRVMLWLLLEGPLCVCICNFKSRTWTGECVLGFSSREDLSKTRRDVSTKFGKTRQCDSFCF